MRTRLIAVLVPLLVLAVGLVGTATAAPAQGGGWVDVIVVLEDGADAPRAAAAAARDHGAEIGFVYESALQGYSARVPAGRLHALQRNPTVVSVEADRVMTVAAQTTPTGVRRIFADTLALDIDQVDDKRVDVDVAVIDTGVDFEHPDLNVAGGVDCTVSSGGGPAWRRTYYCSDTQGTRGDDDHYHGTHVAGTIGALDNDFGVVGVAPGARIWAVKVLNAQGSGYTSGIVAGIDWVTARGDIEVANMSLGGSGTCGSGSAYDTAIDNAVASGVAMVVAAGNDDSNAANFSPASCSDAFTVSALADFNGLAGGGAASTCRLDQDDTLADFSNWGSTVDIAAPGVCIESTYPLEKGSYASISGTSMAAPHVAGAAALLASTSAPTNRSQVFSLYSRLQADGNLNWTDDSGDGVKERLLDISGYTAVLVDNGGGGDPPPPPPPPGDGIDLSANAYKVKGVQHVELTWTGATSTNVDVWRDGTKVDTTANDGSWSENLNTKGGGSYQYRVCEAGTTTCSAVVTAVF